jgi:hypothetical protein
MDGVMAMTSPTSLITLDPPVIERKPVISQVERLEMVVQRRLGSRVRDFRLVSRPDGIILQGRASTYHAKQLAQHAVMEASDEPIVANDIEVC